MTTLLLLLVAIQIIAVVTKKTLIGRILLMSFRIVKSLLAMDYDLLKKLYKFINKKRKHHRSKQRQQNKKVQEKVSGLDNVIDFSEFKDVAEFIRYKKQNKKGM